jgi:hypothetical protein
MLRSFLKLPILSSLKRSFSKSFQEPLLTNFRSFERRATLPLKMSNRSASSAANSDSKLTLNCKALKNMSTKHTINSTISTTSSICVGKAVVTLELRKSLFGANTNKRTIHGFQTGQVFSRIWNRSRMQRTRNPPNSPSTRSTMRRRYNSSRRFGKE